MTGQRKPKDEGVALVTVLMIVAAMSAVAVTLSSAVLASTSRARALDASTQADWLALSSEAFGRTVIADMMTATEGRLFAGMPGLDTPIPIEIEGGLITLSGRDAGNCFNVNRLRASAPADPGVTGAQSKAREDFGMLLDIAGIGGGDTTALTSSLADWMDPDQTPGPSGAEDSYYASPGLQYRTSGQPMANATEMSAVRYFTPEIVEALEPLVCALPDSTALPLNINTLTQRQAPLLSLAFSGVLTVEQARDLIFQRPLGGWVSVEAFLAEPDVVKIAPDLRRQGMLGLQTEYIGMLATIQFRDTRRLIEIMYSVNGSDKAKTIWRERKG